MKIHIVQITDPRPATPNDRCRVTYAQFDDSDKAQKFAWWAMREKYNVRYFSDSKYINISSEEKHMLDGILGEYNESVMRGDSWDSM